MSVPETKKYSSHHVWIDTNTSIVKVGITDYAIQQMGEVIFVDLPQVGDSIHCGEQFCELECAKSVQPVISPVNGTIKEINSNLLDDADLLNASPYQDGWLVAIEIEDNVLTDDQLLSAKDYEALITK